MARKLGLGLSVSSAEFSALSKMAQKQLGQKQAASGMPDEQDYKVIEMALGRFEYENPGLINRMFNQVCVEMSLSGIKKHADLGEGIRKGFWLPQSPGKGFNLERFMERTYPCFWVSEKHMRWFMRKFPQFSFEYAVKRVKV